MADGVQDCQAQCNGTGMSPWRRVTINARRLDDGARIEVNVPPDYTFRAADSASDLDNTYHLRADHVQVGDTLVTTDGKACYVCGVSRRGWFTPKVPRGAE